MIRNIFRIYAAAALCFLQLPALHTFAEETETLDHTGSFLWNSSWQFHEDGSDPAGVELPHDWTITHTPDVSGEAESGFLPGGTGTYEKTFTVSEELKDCEFLLEFEGVYHRASIYVNDQAIAYHPYGYTPFTVDLTDFIRAGEENTVRVLCDTAEASSRWYSGSGIYRNVTMHVKEKLHLDEQRMHAVYDKQTEGPVTTGLSAYLVNHTGEEKDAEVQAVIYDRYGRICAEASQDLTAGEEETLAEIELTVHDPELWDTEHPVLYKAEMSLLYEGEVIDTISTSYGYRNIAFDPDTGFYLNGEPVKLKGVCLHHDLGALGAADNRYIWKQRLEQLKEMGCNAIRITHNPASSTLLDLCAEMGMLVIEESFDTWAYSKNWNLADYAACYNSSVSQDHLVNLRPEWIWAQADIYSMVWAGRNNPAVIMWSIGNEILGNIGLAPEDYPAYADMLCTWVAEADEQRPATIGDNMTDGTSDVQNGMDQAVADHGGTIGLNYALTEEYDALHSSYPDRVFYGSETASELSSRGWYAKHGIDQDHLQVSAWDEEAVEWGCTAQKAWYDVITRDFIAGEFVWTGFDYLGEPEPWNGVEPGSVSGQGPIPKSSYFGIIDTAGIRKDSYWFYQSQWRNDVTVLHILPSWNKGSIPTDMFGKTKVTVYSNAPAVELFLNDRSLGVRHAEKHMTDAGYEYQTYDGEMSLSWDVKWQSGTLEAVAYDDSGNAIPSVSGRNKVTTHGSAASLAFAEKRLRSAADGELITLYVSAYDAEGNQVYGGDQRVFFDVSEGAEIVGMDNGDPCDTDPYQSPETGRKLFSGTVAVIIKVTDPSENIVVSARVEGLESAQAEIAPAEGIHHPVEYQRREGE
ncbi:MAG: glycoside hydrolase family 2 protein [Solobacterium sp.]|nr:glycoside hydrolase family 2 protein [Solobacterium sp.]